MSQWLQVAAIARIDALRFDSVSVEEATKRFEKVFGKECSWGSGNFDDAFEHPESYLPMGSEGSLTMSVWVNPDTHCLDSYTVSIFGSLRDKGEEDAKQIIEWFKNKVSSIATRNAIIDIDSGNSHRIWVYNPDNSPIEK
jgi:hypothetical protein